VTRVFRLRCWAIAAVMIGGSFTSLGAASATTTPSVVVNITTSGILWDNAIRVFFFCTTAACKSASTSNSKAAVAAIQGLQQDLKAAMSAKLPAPYAAVVNTLNLDVNDLVRAVDSINSTTNTVQYYGIGQAVDYITSEIAADVNSLTSFEVGKATPFASWIIGNSGALNVVQRDLGPLTSSKALSTDAAVLTDGLGALRAIQRHLTGPSPLFNQRLASYASQETVLLQSKILLLAGKHASLTARQIVDQQKLMNVALRTLSQLSAALSKAH